MSEAVRYRAVVAYVGTKFHGWQVQANASRTVQAVLERGLRRFIAGSSRPVAAGRTDAGVHADGQVVHFDLPHSADPGRIRDAVNAHLPEDVRLLTVDPVAPGFHARRDAIWKEYLYRWSRAPVIAPRIAPFVAPASIRADAGRMREAAAGLIGERDFRIFSVRHPAGESSVRKILSVEIEEEDAEVRARFRGDAFLRGMVRSICGVLADVARGKAPIERVDELLASGDRRLLAPKAPAKGLTLVRVNYENIFPVDQCEFRSLS
ncbi:MAG TPA: tRNA pseudouridine(38-40) synthase TruA [Thermoanaerobaculia bacterium]